MINIHITRDGETTVVKVLEPRLGADLAADFKEALARQLEDAESGLVVDLSDLTFMDSSGLGALVSLLKITGKGRGIAIARPQEAVKALFRLTRMDKVFRIFPSVDEATAALNPVMPASR